MIAAANLMTRDARTETYQDIQNLIYDVVWKFKRAYGGDFDEMISKANMIFMEAFFSHQQKKASFSTWLHDRLWWGLMDHYRKTRLEKDRVETRESLEDIPAPIFMPFCELISELSQDAQTIVELILDMPQSVEQAALAKGTHPRNIRAALRSYLRVFLGWSEEHVVQTFQEIAEVIND